MSNLGDFGPPLDMGSWHNAYANVVLEFVHRLKGAEARVSIKVTIKVSLKRSNQTEEVGRCRPVDKACRGVVEGQRLRQSGGHLQAFLDECIAPAY